MFPVRDRKSAGEEVGLIKVFITGFLTNTRVYNLISVPHITRLLLGDAIISSETDLRTGSKKEKRSYGNVRKNKAMSRILSFV